MAKSRKQKAKTPVPAKKKKKIAKGKTKAAEYVGSLLELHKLQGILLTQLEKQV